MRLNLVLCTIGVVLLSIATLFEVNYLNYGKPVPYSEWEKISFHDFRGMKRPGMTLNGVSEFAYIKINRKIDYPATGIARVVTYFYPSRSYVFARDIRNPDLLRHELYHFHIAEYWSRLLRKEISERKGRLTKRGIRDLNMQYYRLESSMQEDYDNDSYHSYVMQQQKNWEKKIDSLLLTVRDFSATGVGWK
jgi:hypothetical protein